MDGATAAGGRSCCLSSQDRQSAWADDSAVANRASGSGDRVVERRAFFAAVAGGLLAARLAAQAQQTAKVWRIGFLGYEAATSPIAAVREGLQGLGYVEGKNFVIEYRWGGEDCARLPGLAAELVSQKVDVIVTYGTPGCLAAKRATSTIPIVMAGVGDPVRSGLVASLARPGGNLTGLSIQAFELDIKRKALLKEVVPTVSHVAYLRVPGTQPAAVSESFHGELDAAAKTMGIQLVRFDVHGLDDYERAFSTMAKTGVQALVVATVAPLEAHATKIAGLAAQHRLPSISGTRGFAKADGLLAYGPSLPDLHRRAAGYVDKILKGAKPADMPVEQPTKFRIRHQPQDRQGPRPDDPAVAAGAGG